MFLKMMSPEDKPDNAPDKGYRIMEVDAVRFEKDGDWGIGWKAVLNAGEIAIGVTGNCYILNNSGKTIDTFWPNPKPVPAPPVPQT